MRKGIILLHPESPGMRVIAIRSWWQRLLYPRDFATITEALTYYEYNKMQVVLNNESKLRKEIREEPL